MQLRVLPGSALASSAAVDCFANWLTSPGTRNVMVAAGNTPLELYCRIGERGLKLSHLNVFALDEYVERAAGGTA